MLSVVIASQRSRVGVGAGVGFGAPVVVLAECGLRTRMLGRPWSLRLFADGDAERGDRFALIADGGRPRIVLG